MTELTYDISTTAEVLVDTPAAIATAPEMSRNDRMNGIAQMLIDLKCLAEDDDCVAAGWAYEFIAFMALERLPN